MKSTLMNTEYGAVQMTENSSLNEYDMEKTGLLPLSISDGINEDQRKDAGVSHQSFSFRKGGIALVVVSLTLMFVAAGTFVRFSSNFISSRSEYIDKANFYSILSQTEGSFFGGWGQPKPEKKELVCDDVTPLENFDMSKYAGVWYEQQHVTSFVEPSNCQCTTMEYKDLSGCLEENSDGLESFTLHNSCQFYAFGMRFPRSSLDADAKCDAHGSCYVSFFGRQVTSPNMHVLDTDYTSYSILYDCMRELDTAFLWIMTRDPEISSDKYDEIYNKALSLVPNFDPSTLASKTTQGDMCSYD